MKKNYGNAKTMSGIQFFKLQSKKIKRNDGRNLIEAFNLVHFKRNSLDLELISQSLREANRTYTLYVRQT